jgi:uncharacterized cupin superfamily protein
MTGTSQPTLKPFKVNAEDLPWEPYTQGRFGSIDRDLTDSLRARKLSMVVTQLAPGQVSCPYHLHHSSEELFYVLEGEGLLRHSVEEVRVRPGDVISCPTGKEGLHQFINDTAAPLRYLAISTVEQIDICEYPDSDKVLAVAGTPGARSFRAVYPRAGEVDYWQGEE